MLCLEHTNYKANECTLLCFETSSPFAGKRKCFSFYMAICPNIWFDRYERKAKPMGVFGDTLFPAHFFPISLKARVKGREKKITSSPGNESPGRTKAPEEYVTSYILYMWVNRQFLGLAKCTRGLVQEKNQSLKAGHFSFTFRLLGGAWQVRGRPAELFP